MGGKIHMVKSPHGRVPARYDAWVSTNDYSDEDFSRAVGVEIVAARKMRGISQEDLALRAGIGLRSLQRYEVGDRDLTLKVLWAFTEVLGMEAADLLAAAQKRVQKRPQE